MKHAKRNTFSIVSKYKKMNKHIFAFFIKSLFAIALMTPLSILAQITVSVAVTEPTCFGYTNGQATATPSGGTAPYFYNWSNGQGGGNVCSGLAAGSYSVTVSDAMGISKIENFTVGQPTLVSPSIAQSGRTCSTTGSYTGSAIGGVSPYTFSWLNMGTNAVINNATMTNPAVGSYQLRVTDNNGCMQARTIDVLPVLSVSVSVVDATCGGTCDGAAEAIPRVGQNLIHIVGILKIAQHALSYLCRVAIIQ